MINPVIYSKDDWEKRHFTPFYINVKQYGILLEKFESLSDGIDVAFNTFADIFEPNEVNKYVNNPDHRYVLSSHFIPVLTRNENYEGLNYAVAVDPEAKTFYGIKVISHGETNGKGSVVLKDEDYLNYFKGLSLEATFDSTSAATDVTTGSSVTSKGMDTSIAKVAKFVLDNMVGGAE